MGTITINRDVFDEMLNHLENAQKDIYVQSTQDVIDEAKAALSIHDVSERNIAIGDYVWYNERIHKVQKIRFDDEFWQGKEIAIIDIQAKDTKDVPTRVLRYVR